MSSRGMGFVIGLGPENTAANPHALEIDDRLGENRKPRRLGAVRPSLKSLAVRHHKLIVDPAVRRIPLPGVAVLGRDIDDGVDVRKVLPAPGIGFVDRHHPNAEKEETGSERERLTLYLFRSRERLLAISFQHPALSAGGMLL